MCLSTVYKTDGAQKQMLCKNVSTVTMKDGKYIFTDIMGIPYTYPGKIERIDLMDNYIYVTDAD